MNKICAGILAFLYIIMFCVIKPLDCFLEAFIQSRAYNIAFFIECFVDAWNDKRKPKWNDYKNFFEGI